MFKLKRKLYLIICVVVLCLNLTGSLSAYRNWYWDGRGYSHNLPTAHTVTLTADGRSESAWACEGATARTNYILSHNIYRISGYAYGGKCL